MDSIHTTPDHALPRDRGARFLAHAPGHGGGGADALRQSTCGGFVITVLLHTDMASPHLQHAGPCP